MSNLLKAFLLADGVLAFAVLVFVVIVLSVSFYKKPARVMTETVEVDDKNEPVKELVIGGLEDVMEIKRASAHREKPQK